MNAKNARLVIVLPLLICGVPAFAVDDDAEVAELQAVAKDFDRLRKPETLDKLIEMLPVRNYGKGKKSAEMLFIYARNRRQRFTWLDVFLNQPAVMKRYDEVATKLKQGFEDKTNPAASAINGGLLALIRARQGRKEEANRIAGDALHKMDALGLSRKIWFARRWSQTQLLDKPTGELLLKNIYPDVAPLLLSVTNRSGDSATELKAIESLEQGLYATLASTARDEYFSAAQSAASDTVPVSYTHLTLPTNREV